MKVSPLCCLAALALLVGAGPVRAAISIPSDGSDGAFNPTASVTVDLSQAVTGTWSQSNAANAGKGVYDPAKWAVVFKYSSVNIPAGVTVTFKNHPSRAPVIWLVQNSVNIAKDGRIILDGNAVETGEPGPGGFRSSRSYSTGGFGPGGADKPQYHAGHANPGGGVGAGRPYGNAEVLPLMGGSGTDVNGSGGGAILIAASGVITVDGAMSSLGASDNWAGVRGSAGAIRLVADRIDGTGSLNCNHGGYGDGRIRLEANRLEPTLSSILPMPSAGRPDSPPVIWPAAAAPTARIVSVGTETVPTDPRAAIGAGADVLPDVLASASSVPVVIETRNVPVNSVVNLRIVPPNANASVVQAAFTSGDASLARWTVQVNPLAGTTILQVRVEAP